MACNGEGGRDPPQLAPSLSLFSLTEPAGEGALQVGDKECLGLNSATLVPIARPN